MRTSRLLAVVGLLGATLLTGAAPVPSHLPRPAVRVLVYHDMEGLAGQDDLNTIRFDHPKDYVKGQQYLVADINTVIAGLFEGGATQVDVIDAHGSGNPDPDIPAGALDSRAHQIFRDQPFRGYVDLVAPNVYDAIAVVGMHAKTGSRGFASHTVTIGIALEVNGKEITETELVGYSWGREGVPIIFGSGDDRLADDLKTMPWIQFVVTKKATSASTVELRPVDEVHAEMRSKAAQAVRNLSKAQPMRLGSPIRAAMRVVPPASLEPLKGIPGIKYSDNRVEFEAADFGAVYDAWMSILNVARLAYPQLLMETIAARPDAAALRLEFTDRLFARWADYESGRWTPPKPPAPVAGRKYHGSN
jgi:D-amino peptidase